MSLITEEVEIKLTSSTIKYYESKGYNIERKLNKYKKFTVPINTKIIVKVNDLPIGSHEKVEIECDGCHKKYKITWRQYLNQVNEEKIYCNNCKSIWIRNYSFNIDINNTKIKDITGIKHGLLTPIKIDIKRIKKEKDDGIKYPPTYWLCKCDCGNEELASVRVGSLQSGATTSCGCESYKNITKIKDLTGQKFGHLTVAEIDNDRMVNEVKEGRRKKIYWLCECDCGNPNLQSVWSSHLKRKEVVSCGCEISKGEKIINEYLSKNKTYFVTQKEFGGLIGLNGGNLSYDFYLPKYNLLIEYQGQQHEKYIKGFHKTKKDFEKQQEHDKRKKEYAKSHNIELLEIWYWDFDNIE